LGDFTLSSVTSIIILGPWTERGVPSARQPINLINRYFAESEIQHDKSPMVDVSPHTGGTKGMAGAIFTKGANYLDLHDFLSWLVKQKFHYPFQYNILISREYASDQHYHHITLDKLIEDQRWDEVDWIA
jgi:hypothetical protein